MASPIQRPNSAPEPLTIDTLRGFPGCENYSEDEAAEVIQTLDTLARVFLQAAVRHGTHYDHQTVGLPVEKDHDTSLISAA